MRNERDTATLLHRQWMAGQEETREVIYTLGCRADACCQGRKPCPTPDACRLPVESVESEHPWLWLIFAIGFVGTIALSAVFK